MHFECPNCNTRFAAEGIKKEFNDPVYGACLQIIASCPECNGESHEHQEPKPYKKGAGSESGGSCGSGCCCHNH